MTTIGQYQPVIPLTLSYGANNYSGYGYDGYDRHDRYDGYGGHGGHGGHGGRYRYSGIREDLWHGFNKIKGNIHGSSNSLHNSIRLGTSVLRSDLHNNTAFITSRIISQANANALAINSSEIETRQSLQRQSNYTNNNINRESFNNRLATYQAASANQLAIQQTAFANQLAIQQTAMANQLAMQQSAFFTRRRIEKSGRQLSKSINRMTVRANEIASENRMIAYNQTRLILQGNKQIKISQGRDLGAIQLQAANYKGYLQNHITKTAADGVLKTVQTTSEIMKKIIECCCANNMGHGTTQNIIIQNTNSNQQSFQQGENNRLQQALSNAQQNALLSKI